MTDGSGPKHMVAVVGAGPAGIFAARQLALEGAYVALFNRDIKPGGLAEYGIYPEKHKMKEGLRAQFKQVLATPNLEYFGNVKIGLDGDICIEDLLNLGFQAVLVTVGAQGTKWLGLPGENLDGVYHAKDIVYHYNMLPPFSSQPYTIGKRVAIIGAGNVMLDLARWLVVDQKVEEVTTIVRRGPAEVKFTRHELEFIVRSLDVQAYDEELNRIAPMMRVLGQDPAEPRALITSALDRACEIDSPTRFRMRFLLSPVRMIGDESGRLKQIELENNRLTLSEKGEVKARGLGTFQKMDVDTVIFAIGDRVDERFGLPVQGNEFVKNPQPRFPVEGASFEAFDPQVGVPLEGVFVAGWSRLASTGLVGVARKDGASGARAVQQYLQTVPTLERINLEPLRQQLREVGKPVVTYADLLRLEAAEKQHCVELGLEHFKYAYNDEMLQAMGLAVPD